MAEIGIETDALTSELSRVGRRSQIFAVIDAAHFEYLQDTLTNARLRFDPLYLDEVDNAAIASGPHLVHVTGPSQIAKLREIVGEAPACVWWVWPDDRDAGSAILRHLRGLNMVEIPADRFDSADVYDDMGQKQEPGAGYETVLFRHGDTNVISMALPVLYQDQVARFFGAAVAVVVDAPDYGGTRSYEKPDDLSSARRGFLRFSHQQYEALYGTRVDAMSFDVERYVRTATPARSGEHNSSDFDKAISESLKAGRRLRLRSKGAYCRWGLLYFTSDGRIEKSEKFNRLMVDDRDGSTPDQRLQRVFDAFYTRL